MPVGYLLFIHHQNLIFYQSVPLSNLQPYDFYLLCKRRSPAALFSCKTVDAGLGRRCDGTDQGCLDVRQRGSERSGRL